MAASFKALEPFAGVGVADRYREEAEAKGQHGYIQHEMLLWCRPDQRPSRLLDREVPLHAFVFETGATLKL
jgi:hypothetical protein